jgi:hypothetical protein
VLVATACFLVVGLYYAFRVNPTPAEEQYALYSSYIEDGPTGESHSLGDRHQILLIFADTTLGADPTDAQQWRFKLASLANLR